MYFTVSNCPVYTPIFFDKKIHPTCSYQIPTRDFLCNAKKALCINHHANFFRIFHPITLIPYYRAIRYCKVQICRDFAIAKYWQIRSFYLESTLEQVLICVHQSLEYVRTLSKNPIKFNRNFLQGHIFNDTIEKIRKNIGLQYINLLSWQQ